MVHGFALLISISMFPSYSSSVRGPVEAFSLVSDMNYVAQNAARIIRALFEIALKKAWPTVANRLARAVIPSKRYYPFSNQLVRMY